MPRPTRRPTTACRRRTAAAATCGSSTPSSTSTRARPTAATSSRSSPAPATTPRRPCRRSTRDGDPELYAIDIDGKHLKRLTEAKGYDGGAFFSPDGKRIVYRANHPEGADELAKYDELVKEHLVRPTRLELFVMNADGGDQKQITRNGKANFAPYFHPDGKRIAFSSNQSDEKGRDFDIFLINDDGSGQEQVTHNPSFDGFPMFTRDGKSLVFASNRGAAKEGDTNVFLAEWVD
jgi:TolB protein